MSILVGMIIVLSFGFISSYLINSEVLRDSLSALPIPYDFVITSSVYLVGFLIYYFIIPKNKHIEDEIGSINEAIKRFVTSKEFNVENEVKNPILQQTINFMNQLVDEFNNLTQNNQKKMESLNNDIEIYKDLLNLEYPMVAMINYNEKIVKANKRFLDFFGFENEVNFNMNFKKLSDTFKEELSKNWLNDYLEKEFNVTIKDKRFKVYVEKTKNPLEFVISFMDVTSLENIIDKLESEREYVSANLKTIYAINKKYEITMIRMLNYENYAMHLGTGILEVFEEEFAKRIKNIGYKEVFKVEDGIYAIYDYHPDFNRYKKILEETLVVTISKDSYLFNPLVVLGSGVNFEQAKQQIFEVSKTLVSSERRTFKFDVDFIKSINRSIRQDSVHLSYRKVNDGKTLLVQPIVQDNYNGIVLDHNTILSYATSFNIYLLLLKKMILNHVSFLKDYKIIINITSIDLLSVTALNDLLTLIKREELHVVFNVEINSKYSQVLPILKHIKSYAQLGIRHIGRGFVSFRDIYALKVEYLEIDDSIIELIYQNPQWKFLLDSVKLIISAQNTKLIANQYSDNKVIKIEKEEIEVI